jgi:hypothetical protein
MIEFTSSQDEITPTAIVARPSRFLIASANGVWYERPKAGSSSGVTWPVDTSMASAPAAWNARAISTASSPVMPPGYQSVAEIRTVMGLSAGQAWRMAVNTSSG